MIKLGNFNVVLDTCVLFKAPIRDLLLRLADDQLYQPYWSAQIIQELTKNLMDKRGLTQTQADKLVNCLMDAFPQSLIETHNDLFDNLKINHKDKHVLAAAILSKSQVIVTDNIKDFPVNIISKYNIEAQTPDTFLLNILDLDTLTVLKVIYEQQKALKAPPITLAELIEKFQTHIPHFTKALKQTPMIHNNL